MAKKKLKNNLDRFSGADWFKSVQEQEIIVAGNGGIGSWVAMLLSRINPKRIILIDFDTVEETNMAGQFFNVTDIMKEKTTALSENMIKFSDYINTSCITDMYTERSMTSDIMICGFDNMIARKVFYNNWKKHVQAHENPEQCLFIDGRLSAEVLQVVTITGLNEKAMKHYEEKLLFSDEEAEEELCSYKQTSYCAALIGGFIVNSFINFITNLKDPVRVLPYFIEYNCKHFKVKYDRV